MNGKTNAGYSTGTGGILVALKAPTNLAVVSNTKDSLAITWTDPEDEYSQPSNVLVGEFAYSKLIRKIGSAPANANDGVLVVESGIRNQYQSSPYIDSGLQTGVVYYYAVFSFTTSGVESPGITYMYDLKGYDSVLANNTWDTIALAIQNGDANSMWPVGSTKDVAFTNGETYTFELLSYDAPLSVYDPDNMYGKPNVNVVLFAMVHCTATTSAFASDETGRGIERYYESDRLRSVIDNYYDLMPSDLKPYVATISMVGDNFPTFPFSKSLVEEFLPTAERRIKKMANGTGAATQWWISDIDTNADERWNYGLFVDSNGAKRFTAYEYSSEGLYPFRMNRQKGVCFCFCIEQPTH